MNAQVASGLSAAAAVAAVLSLGCSPPATVRPGTHWPPLPQGWKEVSSYLLSPVGGGSEHVMAWVRTGTAEYLWLGRAAPPDPTGRPVWELRDTLHLPRLGSDQSLVIAECTLEHSPRDVEIAAIAKNSDTDSLTVISAAWRADGVTERFTPIPVAGIACHNPGYGLD